MGATEVGVAYATILPSAKGFARNLKKAIGKELEGLDRMVDEALDGAAITVPVRPEFRASDVPDEVPTRTGREPTLPVRLDPLTQALQDDIRRQLAQIRDVTAQIDVDADTDGLRAEIAAAIRSVEASLSARVPTEPGGSGEYERDLRAQVAAVAARVKAHVKAEVRVDVDDPLRGGVGEAGNSIGRTLASGIMSTLSSGLSTVSGPVLFVGLIASAVAVGPLIGATIAGGVLAALGGGVIGLAFAALAQDPLLQRAASGLAGTIQSTLARAAGPLLGTEEKPGPILVAIETLTDLVVELEPQLREMFEAVGPYIPVLAAGIADFVRAVLPGLVAAVKASGPILQTIANQMGPMGEQLGFFLETMALLGPAASDALRIVFGLLRITMGAATALLWILGSVFGGIYWLYEQLKGFTKRAWDFVAEVWTTKGASLKEKAQALVGAVLRLWDRLVGRLPSGLSSAITGVIRQVTRLPGRILSALGDLGGLLYQAGRNVVSGLIRGMRSMLNPLSGVGAAVAQTVRDHFPYSPAKRGPLSGGGNPYYAGRSIVAQLASGVVSGLPTARGAASDLAETFALSGSPLASPPPAYRLPGAAVAPPPAAPRLLFGGGAPQDFITWVRNNVRVDYNGDPGLAFGS
ncbi:hypothetical protein CSH63_17955 [Micromonospora tulbaghiae]|uniref:Phage-related protein n=1 Tax=Micromonospora tulbaghiae TaxID=479978 RepID=A0A386WLM2_9ACTN|nr:hypothetical protein [Micromonospora tulbaghiae]AYF29315.1 hypothetical protein CSH63_17955 [Micromonospora tulbaghiae]